ncbi:hypothetical protein E1B28_012654 [Marasmius oreades]|uniref:Protein kinase domain-containing protein n=1 Tax=Marasmius oreades TaxID=181124 RepID=A0A9P7UNX2_9AGAR|nr:uncharacterized protein E1B28_012654 [Marasmius oreades]KAG7088683.1 hypothetical protein E1B28_012654 [Marasmius oreades]
MSTAIASQASDHFPAYPNLTLKDQRYTILRKLGEGVSATTWLVRDSQSSQPYETYLATKILTVEATQMHETGVSRELEFLKELTDIGSDRESLTMMFDHFVERSPRGLHLCIVQPLYSTSVSGLRRSSPTKSLPLHMTRNILSMLVEALEQLHDRLIVHTDLKLSNLLFGNFLYSDNKALEAYLETHPPETLGDFELEGKRYPIVKEQPIPHQYTWETSAFEAEKFIVYLIDFGHAQRAGEQPTTNCFGALPLRAPEIILHSDFGPGIDIWAVGCLTSELLVGRWLFQPEEGKHGPLKTTTSLR